LSFPLDNWGSWYGAIGPNQAATMMLAMQHIRRTRRDWDMITLDWNGPASIDHGRPGRAMRVAGFAPSKENCHTGSVVRFTGSWGDYLAQKRTKDRHEMRRKLRRVFDREDVELVRHRPRPAASGDGDPRWDLYDRCEQVAASSWQAGTDDGNTLSSPRVRDFLRDAHAEAARLGMVDLNLLTVGGQPAAFAYNYHCDGRLYGFRIGYIPQFRPLGVGMGLLLGMIRDSFARGDVLFDLGDGDMPFKKIVRTEVAVGYRLTHSPLVSLRSQAVRLTQWAKRRKRSEVGGQRSFTVPSSP
jgi:CelD/BcsL family acetyltransferase involved in cellulose biosynthesis